MITNTEELLRELSDKIAEIYDLEFAKEFTELFEDLVSRMKDKSRRNWRLVKKFTAIEKGRDEERRARASVSGVQRGLSREITRRGTLCESAIGRRCGAPREGT